MRFSPETVTTSGVNKSKTARTLGCDSYLISSYDPPYVETICFTEPDLGYYDPGLYNGTYDPGYSGGIQNTPYTGTSSSSGSSGSTGVGGSTGDDGTLNTNDVFIDPPVNGKITDIQSYMKCFNASQSASLSVYVEQPKPGTRKAWTGIPGTARFSAGHTFISITQGNTTRVIGFYPASTMTAGDMGKTIPSALVDDSDHTYNIRINSALSPSQLQALLGYISSYGGSQYSLSNYNCTDFSVGAAAAAGLVLPDTVGSWLGGSGSDPGDLGEDIRSMSPPASGTIDTNSGQADSFNGTC